MRMMLKANVPVETGNARIQDGTLPKILEDVMAQIKPECAYFLAEKGQRGMVMVFDMKDTSDIPSVVEPLFQHGNANLELIPVMNADELGAGLEKYMSSR